MSPPSEGVASVSAAKTALLAASLGVTGWSRVLGQRVIVHPEQPAVDGTEPATDTDPSVAAAQRQLAVLQWIIPLLTGAMVVLNAVQGEMQRPKQVATGTLRRLTRG